VRIDPRRVATDFNADFPPVFDPEHGAHLRTVGDTLGTLSEATAWRSGDNTFFGIMKWREITSANGRDLYLPLFKGW
jgi:hypothetical protein